MDLFEYQGKQLFARYGIPVSDGAPVTTVPEAVEVADGIGYPVVVKAQVQVGGRGKAGGIKLAANSAEASRIEAKPISFTPLNSSHQFAGRVPPVTPLA